MRSKQDDKTLPVTARSLETIIRLSSAHAKARLSQLVEVKDCEGAMDILSFALYHEEDNGTNKRKVEEEDEENEGRMVDENQPPVTLLKPAKKKASPAPAVVVDEFEAFRATLNKMFATAVSSTGDAELMISQIIDETGADSDKAAQWLDKLAKDNVVMVDEDSVMQI